MNALHASCTEVMSEQISRAISKVRSDAEAGAKGKYKAGIRGTAYNKGATLAYYDPEARG